MKIVRNETTVTLDRIGPVHFEPYAPAGAYWTRHYNRTHEQSFRFSVEGRDYHGQVARYIIDGNVRYRVELFTDGRIVRPDHKAEWRLALIAQFCTNFAENGI